MHNSWDTSFEAIGFLNILSTLYDIYLLLMVEMHSSYDDSAVTLVQNDNWSFLEHSCSFSLTASSTILLLLEMAVLQEAIENYLLLS